MLWALTAALAKGMAKKPEQFWANLPDFSAEFAEAVMDRFEDSQKRLRASKLHDRMKRSWMMYYSRSADGSCDETHVTTAGQRDELTLISPNRYWRLTQDNLTLVMEAPPDYEPIALNSDPESQAQCALATGILDWYKRTAHLEDLGVERSEIAMVLAESFEHVRWDPNAGELHAAPAETGGAPVYQGDFVFSIRTRYDVAYDPTSPDRRRPRWWIVREPMSRWDALEAYGNVNAAQSPEAKADAEEMRIAIMRAEKWSHYATEWDYEQHEYEHDDTIAVYWVYVEGCRARPEGRKALVLDAKHVLEDTPLDEDRAGVFRLAASDVIFKPEGHSANFNGMPIAKAYSGQVSMILSNHTSFGLQRIVGARKANVKSHQLDTGLGLVDYDHFDVQNGVPIPKPEVASLLQSPPELFTMADLLKQELDTQMGGSPVRRGDPEATRGDSGSKSALLHAAAQQIGSGFVRAKLRSDEEVATFIISSTRRHATVPRVTRIAGKSHSYAAKQFVGADLRQLSRVLVRQAHPARDTFDGRMAMAEMLIPLPPDQRQQMQSVIFTGKLEPMAQDVEQRRALIDRENEALLDPKMPMPVVLSTDMHAVHILEHAACMTSEDARRNPEIVKRHDMHLAGHVAALTPGSATFAGFELLLATGQQPFPPPGGPTGAPPGKEPPEAKAAPGKPQNGAGDNPGAKMPEQPKNPATGEKAPLPVPAGPSLGPAS